MNKAFVLGGTVPHIELIRQLHERGYYVYLIDYTNNPPAKAVADEHLKASTLDPQEVLELAKEKQIDLIISSCIDQANSTACYVAEQMNLPHPYSYATSLDVTRKGLMKTIFKQGGVPTSDFYIIDKNDPREIRLHYPFVIKPTDANSSKGVFKIESEDEFFEKIEQSLSFSREGKAIVEGFVSGIEIQVDCVSVNGKAHVLMTSDKESLQNGGKELQVAGFSIPGKVCDHYKNKLADIAQKIVDAFHLENTPFFYQAICDDKGVWVLEFAPRIAGGTRFDTVKMFSGYDYINASICSFLHEPMTDVFNVPNDKYVVRHLYMKPGIFTKIEGLDEMLASGEIDTYFPFANPGREISTSMNSGNRIGAIMIKDPSYENAERRLAAAFEKLRLLDENGNDKSYWRN